VPLLDIAPDGQAVISARLPFQEQIDFFRRKLGLPSDRWDDIQRAAHDRGFIVAGAQKADLLQDMKDAVDRAIADGTTLERFREDFEEIVGRHGWHGWTGEDSEAGRAWRTRTIYLTNLATSYAAGRLKQLRDPDLKRLRPYWMYKHSDSVLHPRPLHVSWNGLTLPADHKWFRAHYPPNGWGCQCRVVAVSRAQAERMGGRIVEEAPDDGEDPKTGLPAGIDKGFDYMPGDRADSSLADLVREKLVRLTPQIRAALADYAARVLK
jgi:uncharacterized protein with gpF-like domain